MSHNYFIEILMHMFLLREVRDLNGMTIKLKLIFLQGAGSVVVAS